MEEKVKDFNDELMILKYQGSLPSVVLDSMHTTIDAMPVYPPSKLIQLYIGDGNQQSNEVDFKKAFELLQYLDAEDGNEMEVDIEEWKMLIWCKMILKDGWNDIDTSSDPFDTYSHTVLFRTIQLAQSSGLLSELLPDVVQLMNRPELSDLIKSSKFEFLLRATFERIHRTLLTTST
uniref:Uncharacterized protein n=1 Tax=Ciona savignyi TaxID=51511 RepID=H2YKM4_CIOSA